MHIRILFASCMRVFWQPVGDKWRAQSSVVQCILAGVQTMDAAELCHYDDVLSAQKVRSVCMAVTSLMQLCTGVDDACT